MTGSPETSDRLVRTVGEMLKVIAPALREILTSDELAATTTQVIHCAAGHTMRTLDQWPVRDASDVLDEETLLDFRVLSDRGGSWMQGIETAEEMYQRFRSELQDFVAESTFGWGQWRP